MAFYAGKSLGQLLRNGPLAPKEAVAIACQIAQGLQEAHSRKIVHRDIKPTNVMITPSGALKIVDFGLARVISAESATVTGVTGTVKYMSPSRRFERTTVSAILVAVLHEAPRPMNDLPMELQRFVYRALSKNPEKRYQHWRCSRTWRRFRAEIAAEHPASAKHRRAEQISGSSLASPFLHWPVYCSFQSFANGSNDYG